MSTAIAYKTKPNFEGKAARELESLGINAVVPYDDTGKRKRVTAPGYVFAGRVVSNAFLRHVKGKVGPVRPGDLVCLYVFKPRARPAPSNPFSIGQPVLIGEIPGTIASTEGSKCLVAVSMLGKSHVRTLHYSRLRPG
ncbi:MAG: hypothetical protein ABL893_04610 [Hyphomicrobium sp.]